MNLTKRKIILLLILIGLTSLPFKLYTVDFSLPIHFDNLTYTLEAIQYSNGEHFIPQKKNPGWPLFISPFTLLINSNNFVDYSNLVRALSLGISTFSILPMYLIGRKFFNEKYSLIVSILFAFEPHLNRVSGEGLAEPLYILMFIVSFFFILNKNPKYAYLSFLFGGLFWWVRLEGFIIAPILSVVFFLNFRKFPNLIRNYCICIIIFLAVVSPMLVQRYVQYGDPFYIWYNTTLFSTDYAELLTSPSNASAMDYLSENGTLSFIHRFILTGILNISTGLVKNCFPYLLLLISFGVIFSLRAFDQNVQHIRANWIFILMTLGVLTIPFATIPDKRFLFQLYPFLIIFSTIPIQRVTEYGLSTFSLSQHQKNIFLIIVISIIIILSAAYTHGFWKYGYGKPDMIEEHEKMEYARFLVHNLDGRMLSDTGTTDYVRYIQITEPSPVFKTLKPNLERNPYPDTYTPGSFAQITIDGKTVEELVSRGEKLGLRYIAVNGEGSYFFTFLGDVYKNEQKYPYLIKIYDSTDKAFKKFKVKVFEIDYKKFHMTQSSK